MFEREIIGVGSKLDKESALAPISIVDVIGHQLHDTFWLPKKSVMDYRTHVCWIDHQWLQAARALKVFQVDIAKLLDGRILVGCAIAFYRTCDGLDSALPRQLGQFELRKR